MTIRIPFREINGCPCISYDNTLCEDGLDNSEVIVYTCPNCNGDLFNSKDLNWMKNGYWKAPQFTLKLKNYSPEDENIICTDCGNIIKIDFFSYMG